MKNNNVMSAVLPFLILGTLVVVPLFLAAVLAAYIRMPLFGIISSYGLFGFVLIIIGSLRKTKIEVTDDLVVNVIRRGAAEGLITSTIVLNIVFALGACGVTLTQ